MTGPTLCLDMDGVLLVGPGTPPALYTAAASAALAELVPDTDPSAETCAILGNDGYTDRFEDHCHRLGVDPRACWRLKDEHASRLAHERIRSGEHGVYDDVAAIRDLVSTHRSALVSNNRQATVEFVASYLDLDFDVVRGREPTPGAYRRRKPRPDFIEAALAELEVAGGIYVGDRPTDVVAATRAGLEPAFLRRPHNRDVELPTEATYELTSLWDLPDAVERLA